MHVGYRAILVSCSQKKAWLHARRGSGTFIRSGTARWTSLYCLTAPPDVEGWALSRAVARSAQRTCLDLAACTRQVTAHGRTQYDAFGRGCSERPPTRTRLKWTSDVSFFFLIPTNNQLRVYDQRGSPRVPQSLSNGIGSSI
jgi:hypothetical protein